MAYFLFFTLLAACLSIAGYLFLSWKKASSSVDVPSNTGKTLSPIIRSFLAGIFLFWLIQTAVERQLLGPAALFSFFAESKPQTVKLALCCATVLFCLFFETTSFGGRLRNHLHKAAEKKQFLFLVSLVVVVLFFLWTLRITVLSYMTNDEYGIFTRIIAAAETGIQAAANTFSHVLFCGALAVLYRMFPDGYWYILYHLAALLGSLVILCWCILWKTRIVHWPLMRSCLLLFLVCSGLFMYTFSQISFTVTPVVVGSAAIALLLCRQDLKTTAGLVMSDMVSVLLILLCYLQRESSGTALLCFWGLTCAYVLYHLLASKTHSRKRDVVRFLAYVLIVVLLIVCADLVSGLDCLGKDSSYFNAEYYRSLIVDFLAEHITLEQYERAGFPNELAILLHGWYFMDERINTETLKTLANIYYADQALIADNSLHITLQGYLSSLFHTVVSDPQILWRTAALLSLLLLTLFSCLSDFRRYWPEFLCALCSCGGALILFLYLVSLGRILTRVFLVVLFPALILVLFMALTAQSAVSDTGLRSPKPALTVSASVFAALFCFFCCTSLYHVPYATEPASRETLFSTQWAIEDYANDHADICFVSNIYDTNHDPLHAPDYPSNFFLWGNIGETVTGGDRMYADDFFRDDVQFMCQTPSYIMFLLQYLSLDYGPVQAKDIAHITDNIYIYDLSQITPEDSYTGWYEWNGLTYYFENGRAVTGTHIIDGEEYEFAPAGDESFLIRLETDDGVVYSTKAYTLVESNP